jgi:phytoene/squalene synthetase
VSLACGANEADLDGGRLTDAWVAALSACVDVTRELYAGGRAVCDGVHGRLRLELRFTWLGGRRILDRVAEHRHDVLTHRPSLGAADVPRLLWQAARWEGVAA